MKVTEHVQHLLRQGHKPKELVALGFSKRVVTREHRRLKEERASAKTKVPAATAQAETPLPTLPESPEKIATIWQKVQSMANDLLRIDRLIQALSEVATVITAAREFGNYRYEACPYQKDGLCTLHTWFSKSEIPVGIGEPALAENENPEWHVKPSPLYCAVCSVPLEDRIDDLENKLSGDPFSGAQYQFTCGSCGSKGLIAAKIICTKCRHETYLGWWPRKE